MTRTRRQFLLSVPLAAAGTQFAQTCSLLAQGRSPGPLTAAGRNSSFGLSIPTTHPRLWWNAERLALARAWYARNEQPLRQDDLLGHAFRYVMKGDRRDARTAIQAALNLKVDVTRSASNEARWFGETAILIFDWAHDQFTADERAGFIERWNGYIDGLSKKQWGGRDMPESNYFWGYLRNEIEWGIASYHENPEAPRILDMALNGRWQSSYLPFAAGPSRGGLPIEGSQYGRYQLQYALVPLMACHLLGRPLHEETDFFRDAVFWLNYATPSGPTVPKAGGKARWEVFPMGDDQFFQFGGSAEGIEYASYAGMAAELWRGTPVAHAARRWLRLTSATPPAFIAAVDSRSGDPLTETNLPLDYFVPGPQHFFTRTSWKTGALAVHLQLGSGHGRPHEHADHGNWQMWRGGHWLTRETTGYSQETYAANAHNVLLVNGKGIADGDRNGQAIVTRLGTRDDVSYVAVDLSAEYRNDRTKASHRRERDNPAAAMVEREFLFIRPLETLVIFDRIRSSDLLMPAASVKKTFLAHFEQPPVVKGPTEVHGISGDQTLRLLTLAPANAIRRIVFEGEPIGQHRVEVETSGAEQSYFLHVAQARGRNDADATVRVSESPSQYEITLEHPERGFARVVFPKATATPASCTYSRSALPKAAALLPNRKQAMRVTNDGPVWEA